MRQTTTLSDWSTMRQRAKLKLIITIINNNKDFDVLEKSQVTVHKQDKMMKQHKDKKFRYRQVPNDYPINSTLFCKAMKFLVSI